MLTNGEQCWVLWKGRAHFAQVVFMPHDPERLVMYCKQGMCCSGMRIVERHEVEKLEDTAGVQACQPV